MSADRGHPHEDAAPGKARIRAVPWRTSTAEKVKGSLGEIPAYVRRARRTEDAERALYVAAASRREELLRFVSLRLARYLDSLPEGSSPSESVREIRREVARHPALADRPRRSIRRRGKDPERALEALAETVDRFNANWRRWVREEAPIAEANREIEGYNRHYPEERQAALRYVPFDRLRFEKKAPLAEADVLAAFPCLPRPD